MLHVFLINPFSGSKNFSRKIRDELKKVNDIDYFVFNILYKEHEYILVAQLLKYLEGNDLRFYVCGGMGTLHNVANALNDANMLDKVELAWLPKGKSNTFVHEINGEMTKITDLRALIRGSTVPLDYIKTNHGVAINNISMGMDGPVLYSRAKLNSLGIESGHVLNLLSTIYGIFSSKPTYLHMKTDMEDIDDYFAEIFFGNGSYIGNNLKLVGKTKQDDGIGDYVYYRTNSNNGLKSLVILSEIGRKNFSNIKQNCRFGKSKTMFVEAKNPILVNMDGELYRQYNSWEIEMVEKGINFVLPKGVTFYE